MFNFSKKKNDNETIIPIDMVYNYSGESYDKLFIIKRGKSSKKIRIHTGDDQFICYADNGNELKIILESLLDGQWQ